MTIGVDVDDFCALESLLDDPWFGDEPADGQRDRRALTTTRLGAFPAAAESQHRRGELGTAARQRIRALR